LHGAERNTLGSRRTGAGTGAYLLAIKLRVGDMVKTDPLQKLRDRAAECERLAAEVKDSTAREMFLYVAARWQALIAEDEAAQKRNLWEHCAFSHE
jgi:hypothetical protein